MRINNARFWVFHRGGWVKLTLEPDECQAIGGGGDTDEGWHSWAETYEFDGEYVYRYSDSRGADCDGPYEDGRTVHCHRGMLKARDMHEFEQERAECWGDDPTKPEFNENVGIFAPAWGEVSSRHRDVFAEQMGY